MAVLKLLVVVLKSESAPTAVFAAALLENNALTPYGRVIVARYIVAERSIPVCRVAVACGIAEHRAVTRGSVSFTGGIHPKRESSVGRVEIAFGVAGKGECSMGRFPRQLCCVKEWPLQQRYC